MRWAAAANVLEQLLIAGSTVVLVRLLSPSDLGLVAAANVALGLLALTTQLGFGTAVVTHGQLTDRACSTLFWASVSAGAAVGLLAALAAPALAAALGEPQSAVYLRGLAGVLAVKTAAVVPRALLQRDGRFPTLYRVQLCGAFVYPVVALPLAVLGAGPWSMVLGHAVAATISLGGYLLAARLSLSPVLDRATLRRHAGLTGGTLAITLVSYLLKNADYFVVGRVGTARTLGTYYVAYVLPSLVRLRLTTLVGELLLPVYARLQDDDEGTVTEVRRALTLVGLVGLPIMLGLAVVAGELVPLLFGPGWTSAVVPLRLIALSGLGDLVTVSGFTVLMGRGRWQTVLQLQVLRLLVFAGLLAAASAATRLLVAVAVAVAMSSLVNVVTAQVQLARALGVRVTVLYLPLLAPASWGVALVAVAVLARQLVLPLAPEAAVLAITVLAGSAAYAGATACLFPRAGERARADLLAVARR